MNSRSPLRCSKNALQISDDDGEPTSDCVGDLIVFAFPPFHTTDVSAALGELAPVLSVPATVERRCSCSGGGEDEDRLLDVEPWLPPV